MKQMHLSDIFVFILFILLVLSGVYFSRRIVQYESLSMTKKIVILSSGTAGSLPVTVSPGDTYTDGEITVTVVGMEEKTGTGFNGMLMTLLVSGDAGRMKKIVLGMPFDFYSPAAKLSLKGPILDEQ
ncbi:MAG: hypothetical protein LLG37_06220 [Spirochaetia bacterium]|nr:hypothetical protein [Spirochaetia bacterium]